MADLLVTAAAVMQLHATRARFEQEPLSSFRRDVVADDEWRIQVEAAAAEVMRAERIAIAWAARRIRRMTHVDQNYISASHG